MLTNTNCMYNMIYTKFNEYMNIENNFKYDLQYPSFYKFKNTMYNINQDILSTLNKTIKLDIKTFKDGIKSEDEEFNKDNQPENKFFNISSNYSVTFNKNYVLSCILNLNVNSNVNVNYNELYNYNFDLLTEQKITLKDVFNPNVNYIKLITDYTKYKINQNKTLYYDNVFIEITEDQAFYLTDNSIVIYFDVDSIADKSLGIPKFKMEFKKFMPYINPKFYCSAQNIIKN